MIKYSKSLGSLFKKRKRNNIWHNCENNFDAKIVWAGYRKKGEFLIYFENHKCLRVVHKKTLTSVQLFSHVQLFATQWAAARQASLSTPTPAVYSNSCPLSWWWHPTISSFVVPFSSRLQSFPESGYFQMSQFFTSGGQSIGSSFIIIPFNEYSGLISFRMDWVDFLTFQGTLESLFQHHSSKASILWCSAFFIIQLSHTYMTTGKTIAFSD